MVFISGARPAFLLNITVLAFLLNRYVQVLFVNSCCFRISLLLLLFPRFSINRLPLLEEQSAGAVPKVSVLERVDCNILYCSLLKRETDTLAAAPGVLGLIYAVYVPLASQNPYPIIVYSVANYRPHLSHFWANM